MKNLLVIIVLLSSVSINPLQAQTESDEAEMKAFAEKYVAAYNQEDVEAIKKMYMADAVRVDTEGKEIKGADQIAAFFEDQFIKNKTTLKVNQNNISWSDAQHAFIASGTYEVKGATIVYDLKIDNKGTYENTMIKEKGEWKIAKSVLTAEKD